jgi:hypothetical protein
VKLGGGSLRKERKKMSNLARFSPPLMTADQYDAILARLCKEGIHPAEGLELKSVLAVLIK